MALELNKFQDLGELSAGQADDNWTDIETLVNALEQQVKQSFIVACGAPGADLEVNTGAGWFPVPYNFEVSAVYAEVLTAPAGSAIQVDINLDGTSILSTKLTIDAGEKTSRTAATAAVISTTTLTAGGELTADIDQAGSSTPGTDLMVTLVGKVVAA